MNKINWSTLKKNDKLYLLIPYIDENNYINYHYQESHVINVHNYDWCVNVRFKYTDNNGKRRRVELCVNQTKYDICQLSSSKETRWARNNDVDFGDIIVSFRKYDLEVFFKEVINKTIKIEEERCRQIQLFINNLKKMYNNIKID